MRGFDAVYAELMAFQLFSRTSLSCIILSIFEQCSETDTEHVQNILNVAKVPRDLCLL